jgi:hypothetical protein
MRVNRACSGFVGASPLALAVAALGSLDKGGAVSVLSALGYVDWFSTLASDESTAISVSPEMYLLALVGVVGDSRPSDGGSDIVAR